MMVLVVNGIHCQLQSLLLVAVVYGSCGMNALGSGRFPTESFVGPWSQAHMSQGIQNLLSLELLSLELGILKASTSQHQRKQHVALGKCRLPERLPKASTFNKEPNINATFNYQNHPFCRLPTISKQGFIIRTYENHGFGFGLQC